MAHSLETLRARYTALAAFAGMTVALFTAKVRAHLESMGVETEGNMVAPSTWILAAEHVAQVARDVNTPQHRHDCESCQFICRFQDGNRDYDLWVCLDHSEVVIRWSEHGPDYYARNMRDLQIESQCSYWNKATELFAKFWRDLHALG